MKILLILFLLLGFASYVSASEEINDEKSIYNQEITLSEPEPFRLKTENFEDYSDKYTKDLFGKSVPDIKQEVTNNYTNWLYAMSFLNEKEIPHPYNLPKRAKVLYSKKGVHPNAYAQSISMIANGLIFNQAVDETIYTNSIENKEREGHVWYKPLVGFEGNLLNSDVFVLNNFYGAVLGADSDFYKRGKNSYIRFGAYSAVSDNTSYYRGVNLSSDGVLLGVKAEHYRKKRFEHFTIVNAKINYNNHLSSGQYGTDNYQSFFGGVSFKTGVSFPLLKGKLKLEPFHMVSYTYGKATDYENAAQMQVSGNSLNNIWVTPGIRICAHKNNKTKPYLNLSMPLNFIGGNIEQRINGNEVSNLSLNNYFLCSAGIEKEMKERFSGFIQLSAKAPGRISMGAFAGLKWRI